MLRSKEYVINISPVRWKRPGLCRKRFYDQQKHEKLATGLFLVQQHAGEPRFDSPVHVEITFHMPIPARIKERKNKFWCLNTPDIDNLSAFVFDAITQTEVIWKDDCIVCSMTCKKVYDRNPRTHIIIKELE
jgi:crossover junction endodeoxyribonuclease RusA